MSSPKEFNNKIRKNSLDDLEIEKIRKETAGSIRKSTGSQDDFSVKSPKLSEKEFLAKCTNNKEVAKPKSAIRRFFSSIGNSAIVNKVKSGVNWLLNTKIGKVLTGTAFGRATTIIFATVTLATVFPPAAPIVFAMAGVSLAAVAVGAAFDTYKTRNLRKLATENNLLVKNHGYLKKQEQLFKIDPSLKKVIDEYEADKAKTRDKQIASKKILQINMK